MMSWGRQGEEMIKYGQEAKLPRFSSKVRAIHERFLQSTLLFLKAGTNAAFSTCMNLFLFWLLMTVILVIPVYRVLALASWSMYPELMLSERDQYSSCSRAEQGNPVPFPSGAGGDTYIQVFLHRFLLQTKSWCGKEWTFTINFYLNSGSNYVLCTQFCKAG